VSEAVFTRDLRVSFVEKTSGDVGDGTRYPLLIPGSSAQEKFDRLAELISRISDAKFSGAITADYGTVISLNFTTDTMPLDKYSGTDADCIIERSYAITGSPPTNADRESQIWDGPLATPTHPAATLAYWSNAGGFTTGFSQYAESFAVTSGYYPYGLQGGTEYQAVVELGFTGEIAWVDTNSSGYLLDPLNELYVGLNFFGYTIDDVKLDGSGSGAATLIVDAYTELTGNPNEGPTGDLTFEMETGNLTCALYCSNYAFLSSATSSMTISAVEWWPYAKDSPPAAVWNTATGAKL